MSPLSVHLKGIVCSEDLLAARHRAPVGKRVGEVDGLHVVPDQGLGLDIGAEITRVRSRHQPRGLKKLIKFCR